MRYCRREALSFGHHLGGGPPCRLQFRGPQSELVLQLLTEFPAIGGDSLCDSLRLKPRRLLAGKAALKALLGRGPIGKLAQAAGTIRIVQRESPRCLQLGWSTATASP